ncbi:MAG: hypothetical protein MZV65_37405 [Chromatiales bacterium]|nr:hypothetical protein [Chromatiales bacterium]
MTPRSPRACDHGPAACNSRAAAAARDRRWRGRGAVPGPRPGQSVCDADDPTERLHAGNLADFLTALEGVSHFLYLSGAPAHERSVSLLELELQAEIDKFMLAAFLSARAASGRVPAGLHRLLFDAPVFDPALNAELAERYRAANAYARRYCGWLQRRYLARRGDPGIMSELRRFYRLGHHGKLARIHGTTSLAAASVVTTHCGICSLARVCG